MLSKVCSAALNGIEAFPVEVEVNSGWGDTLVVIVGLPDAAVDQRKQSRRRTIRTAMTGQGVHEPETVDRVRFKDLSSSGSVLNREV